MASFFAVVVVFFSVVSLCFTYKMLKVQGLAYLTVLTLKVKHIYYLTVITLKVKHT